MSTFGGIFSLDGGGFHSFDFYRLPEHCSPFLVFFWCFFFFCFRVIALRPNVLLFSDLGL